MSTTIRAAADKRSAGSTFGAMNAAATNSRGIADVDVEGLLLALTPPCPSRTAADMELNATLLVQAVIILALMAWLTPMLFGPLLKVFDERERRIHGAAEEARKQLGSAGEKSALVEQKTKEAQADARVILTTLRDQAKAKEQQLLDDARDAANVRLAEARTELSGAADAARRSLKDDAKGIADDIVKKVLGRAA